MWRAFCALSCRLWEERVVLLTLVLAASVTLNALAIIRQGQIAARLRHEVTARTTDSRQVRLTFCDELEALKKAQRDRAIESFRQLDRSLRLLGIKRTAGIVAAAREARDAQLRRFAPLNESCVEFAKNPGGGS